jgi:hypothetical protein
MGWYNYPPLPGTKVRIGDTNEEQELGPCLEPCEHRSCRQMREDAASLCRICSRPIGWNNPIYYEEQGLVHRDCLISEVERERAEQLHVRILGEHPDWQPMLSTADRGAWRVNVVAAYETASGGRVAEMESFRTAEEYERYAQRFTRLHGEVVFRNA